MRQTVRIKGKSGCMGDGWFAGSWLDLRPPLRRLAGNVLLQTRKGISDAFPPLADRRVILEEGKTQLLQTGGYFIVSNQIVRTYLQRAELNKDAILLYIYLLGYVDGRKTFPTTGEPNPRYGYAYPSVDKIQNDLSIARRRVSVLSGQLEKCGLLKTMKVTRYGKTTKLYMPIHPNHATDDAVKAPEGKQAVLSH